MVLCIMHTLLLIMSFFYYKQKFDLGNNSNRYYRITVKIPIYIEILYSK